MLSLLTHENIIKYEGHSVTAESVTIFLEYAPGGSIRDILLKNGKL